MSGGQGINEQAHVCIILLLDGLQVVLCIRYHEIACALTRTQLLQTSSNGNSSYISASWSMPSRRFSFIRGR